MDNVIAGVIGAVGVGILGLIGTIRGQSKTARVQEWEQWRKDCEVLRADLRRLEEKVDILTKDRDDAQELVKRHVAELTECHRDYKERLAKTEKERDDLRDELEKANIEIRVLVSASDVNSAVLVERHNAAAAMIASNNGDNS